MNAYLCSQRVKTGSTNKPLRHACNILAILIINKVCDAKRSKVWDAYILR